MYHSAMAPTSSTPKPRPILGSLFLALCLISTLAVALFVQRALDIF